jgi:CBS domain-containing protein
VTISPEQNILEACRLMRERNIGCLVADAEGKMSGILTDRDVALKVTGEAKDPRQTRVREIMTPNPVCISVEKNLHDLTALMHTHHVRRVPVVNGVDKALGIVTMDDLIALLADEMSDLGKTISEAAVSGVA